MSTTPALDYATRGPEAIAISTTFVIVSGLTVFGRFYTRSRIVESGIGIAEYLIFCSWIFAAAFAALVTVQVYYGLGKHSETLTNAQYVQVLKPFYASIPMYQASLSITKASILFQYIRVFGVEPIMRRACYVALCIIISYGGWSVISAIFFCNPIQHFWLKARVGDTSSGNCLNEQAVWFSNAALNILTDILILSLPMPLLNAMQLPRKQKIFLKLIFALGGFACITSIIRLHALYVISISKDITWDNVPIAEWTAVESNIGIMCACLPTLKPLLLKCFPRLQNSSFVGNPAGVRGADVISINPTTGVITTRVAPRGRYAGSASQRWSQSQASHRWSQSQSPQSPRLGNWTGGRFSYARGGGNASFMVQGGNTNNTSPNIDSKSARPYQGYLQIDGEPRLPSEYDSTNDILLGADGVNEGKIKVVTVVDVSARERDMELGHPEPPEQAYWDKGREKDIV